ncbi:VOC family protein [Paeniglutamicibacter cryotolerans]|uniref:Putative 3-demethylubiquinone-9 3-methyltransferase (Glyoxalase superfamily) n=1 Tax=Paeniglutamicibacter cryotolerans TaxID=670079 RepID=A0A839QEC9_9MICC|nr:VOC family protein [Paeniglutamicibacter cryotolerans]MBB2994270.1 putative 3-demethylubiquinone-9 3-methyltransferase (glyoxalase superfamily) [Paeniglutamicibacter cryotolerans]
MRDIVNCLWFDGQGRQAAIFYTGIFPESGLLGDVSLEAPAALEREPAIVEFVLKGRRFIALNGGPQYSFSEAASFQVLCEDQSEVDHYWSGLTDGGEEGQCGWLKDRFGVSWQVVPVRLGELLSDSDPEVVNRVVEAFMAMRKLDIAVIEAAAAG